MTGSAALSPAELAGELAAEQESLDALVSSLAEAQWSVSTPAAGWDIRDQIAHLAFVDELATQALLSPDEFARTLARANADQYAYEAAAAERARRLAGDQTLLWWRKAREQSLTALKEADPDTRLPWFGPPMKLRSFITARLMETWSHGQDVADALGTSRVPADRLAHIAHIGVATRRWSFVSHRQPEPPSDIHVDLWLPSGRRIRWGPPEAADQVRGPALDFCLVVTQRRYWLDTALEVEGSSARAWLEIAQAFAGPPTVTIPGRGIGAKPDSDVSRQTDARS
jgi:uncharacterized protein (TIGR03084 family)